MYKLPALSGAWSYPSLNTEQPTICLLQLECVMKQKCEFKRCSIRSSPATSMTYLSLRKGIFISPYAVEQIDVHYYIETESYNFYSYCNKIQFSIFVRTICMCNKIVSYSINMWLFLKKLFRFWSTPGFGHLVS